MLALVKTKLGAGNVSLIEVQEPQPKPNEVKIRVKACGICGSDLHFLHTEQDAMSIFPPVTLGHEFCGIIESVGSEVHGWKIGDYVTSEPPVSTCGKCIYCQSGLPALCPQRHSLGSGVNGAFAQFIVTPTHRLHKIPANINFNCSSLAEPVACCVHAVIEQVDVKAGDRVLVTGPGPIGLITSQVIKAQGANVYLVGRPEDGDRLRIGEELGIDQIIIDGREDISATISRLTNNDGVDIAFECSGSEGGVQTCFRSLRKRGKYVQVGVSARDSLVNMNIIGSREVSANGAFGSTFTSWDRSLRLISEGKIKIKPLITAELPLSKWEEGFELVQSRKGCKVVLYPE